MNANGESRLLPLSLGRRERGFTIKMSEHPSILRSLRPPIQHLSTKRSWECRVNASGISCTPRKSLTFHNRRLMNGFQKTSGRRGTES